jgi:hypothetical protein
MKIVAQLLPYFFCTVLGVESSKRDVPYTERTVQASRHRSIVQLSPTLRGYRKIRLEDSVLSYSAVHIVVHVYAAR